MARGCCEHCGTVATMHTQLKDLKTTLDGMKSDFRIVKGLVYGTASLILTGAVLGGMAAAAKALGF